MDAEAWEAVIPSMGVMALVRNLRNFDQAGIARGGDRRGHRQDHRRRRGGPGAPVPVPGVGGVQARAVGQLEARARPHARAHRRQHPGARRHARRDRHVGLDAGTGVGPLDHAAGRGRRRHGDGHGQAGLGRRRRDLRPDATRSCSRLAARRCCGASTRWSRSVGSVGHATYGHTAIARWFDPKRHRRVVIFTDDQQHDSGHGPARPRAAHLHVQPRRLPARRRSRRASAAGTRSVASPTPRSRS